MKEQNFLRFHTAWSGNGLSHRLLFDTIRCLDIRIGVPFDVSLGLRLDVRIAGHVDENTRHTAITSALNARSLSMRAPIAPSITWREKRSWPVAR